MLKLAFLKLWRRKSRVVLISLAIIISMSLMTAVLVVRRTMQDNLSLQTDWHIYQPADIILSLDESAQLSESFDDPPVEVNDRPDYLLPSISQKVEGLLDTKDIAFSIEGNDNLEFETAADEPLFNGAAVRYYSSVLAADSHFNHYHLISGQMPVNNRQIAIDLFSAQDNGLSIGDVIKVGSHEIDSEFIFKISGLFEIRSATDGSQQSFLGIASFAVFNQQALRELLNYPADSWSHIRIKGQECDRLNEALAEFKQSFFCQPVNEDNNPIGFSTGIHNLQFLINEVAYISLSAIFLAIMVSIFVIASTFNVILSRSAKELALLRLISFTKGQIFGLITLQGLIIGLFASLLSLGIGLLLAQIILLILGNWLPALGMFGLSFGLGEIIHPFWIGVFIAVLSSCWPAWKASRPTPIAVLTDTYQIKRIGFLLRGLLGSILLSGGLIAFGVASLMLSSSLNASSQAEGSLAAALFMFFIMNSFVCLYLSVITLSPLWIKGLSNLLAFLSHFCRWPNFRLALRRISNNPRRIAAMVNVLALSLLLIIIGTALSSSVKASLEKNIGLLLPFEYSSAAFINESDVDQPTWQDLKTKAENLKNAPETSNFLSIRSTPDGVEHDILNYDGLPPEILAEIEARGPPTSPLAGIDFADLQKIKDKGQISFGDQDINFSSLGDDHILVLDLVAREQQLSLGEEITLKGNSGYEKKYKIAGFYDMSFSISNYFGIDHLIVSLNEHSKLVDKDYQFNLFFDAADGYDHQHISQLLEQDVNNRNIIIISHQEILDAIEDIFKITVFFVLGLSSLALLIVFLGLVNLTILSIWERRKEIGIMRAMGLTRSEIINSVIYETLVIAICGFLAGIVLGILFARMIFWLMSLYFTQVSGEIETNILEIVFSVPILLLLAMFLVQLIVIFLAVIWPAIKAGRLNIIAALSSR